jgi:hypothetical protein
MADTKVVNISGVARPSRRMLNMALALHGPKFAQSIDAMVDDAKTVDALAGALDRALLAGTSKDGRVDMREAALALIKELRRHQK